MASQKWKPIFLVQIYRMVRLGMTDQDVAKTLKCTRKTLWMWEKEKPELKQAVEMAKKELAEGQSFPQWIYSRLSPQLKEIWNKIRKWEKEGNGVAKIELMLQDHGKRVRQQLFLHALCISRFSPSVAMQKVNITKKELDDWINNDVEFGELVSEIQWHKGNFFEESLVKLVREGNPAAVLFANKTYNKDRGYGQRTQVDVNVSGSIAHGVMDLSEIMPYLTEACKLEMLEGIRKLEQDRQRKPVDVLEHVRQEVLEVE